MRRIALCTSSASAFFVVWSLVSMPPCVSAQEGAFAVHPSTQDPSRRVTPEDLERWETELSNWGRWGSDDQIGALNLITPEKMREAASLVRDGVTVGLQIFPIGGEGMETGRFGENRHWMALINSDGTVSRAIDVIQLSLHDGLMSHMDALCHYALERDGKSVIFNGYPNNLTAAGCQDLAADRMGPGYVTRGVLVDMPLLRGVDWLEPSTPIYVEDLEAWEEFAGIKIGPGDALLVRGGRWALRDARGPWDYGEGGAGLHASVLPFLHERGVALLVSDAVNDVQPSGVEGVRRPVHTITQTVIGLPIVDNGYLEETAEVAERLQRWEFMLFWHIMQIPGGTASPFNALATF